MWSQGREGFLKPNTKRKKQKETIDTFKLLYNKIHLNMKRQFIDWGKVTALCVTKKGSVSRKKSHMQKRKTTPKRGEGKTHKQIHRIGNWIDNKHLKRCLSSLVTWEILIKARGNHLKAIGLAKNKIKKKNIPQHQVLVGTWGNGTSYSADGSKNL